MKILMDSILIRPIVQNITNVPMELQSFNLVHQVYFGMLALNIVTGQQT